MAMPSPSIFLIIGTSFSIAFLVCGVYSIVISFSVWVCCSRKDQSSCSSTFMKWVPEGNPCRSSVVFNVKSFVGPKLCSMSNRNDLVAFWSNHRFALIFEKAFLFGISLKLISRSSSSQTSVESSFVMAMCLSCFFCFFGVSEGNLSSLSCLTRFYQFSMLNLVFKI